MSEHFNSPPDAAVIDYSWNSRSYPRIGFYKWTGTGWSSSYPAIAAHFTSLYVERGDDDARKALGGL